MNITIHLLIIFTLALASKALALEWSSQLVNLTPEAGAKEVRTKYAFRNDTKGTVHIVDLTTSCGCTVATTRSPDIPAGASGTIDVVFTIGQRTGQQEKKIFVQTDESPDPVVLELKVKLPDPAAGHTKAD